MEDLKYRLFIGLVAGLFAVLIGLGWPLALIVFCIVASVDHNHNENVRKQKGSKQGDVFSR